MSDTTLKLAVLGALGGHPVSGTVRPNRNDLLALELARQLSTDVTLLHAGERRPELDDYFAYGVKRIALVPLAEGQDVAAALAEELAAYDIILTGTRAAGGEGSGMVPYELAERLGVPVIGQVLGLSIADGEAEITQGLSKGRRRRVRVGLPAVIAVHPNAPFRPRYAHARRLAGDLDVRPTPAGTGTAQLWTAEAAHKRPVVFKAAETKSGHARLLSAIVSESKGGTVVRTGTPAEKADAILAYLREHHLIEW